jgi:hypothetical protein
MRAVVVVRGAVDERDIWPYAVMSESDGERTTLTVTVHDSQELVGVLSSLAALGLDVTSTQLIQRAGGRGSGSRRRQEEISSSEDDAGAKSDRDSGVQ